MKKAKSTQSKNVKPEGSNESSEKHVGQVGLNDRSFRRIAFTLLTLTAVTVIAIGIYMWYNFTSRSNLVLVVPDKPDYYVHIQTKEVLKPFLANKKPESLDRFEAFIQSNPLLKAVKDPKELGISPHTDWIFFGKGDAHFMALSVFSESAFSAYLQKQVEKGLLHPVVKKELFSSHKLQNQNAYIAYKHKAMVFCWFTDSVEDVKRAENAFQEVFSGRTSTFMQTKGVQELYDHDADILVWTAKPEGIKWNTTSTGFISSIALNFEEKQLKTWQPAGAANCEWLRISGNTAAIIPNQMDANQGLDQILYQLTTYLNLNLAK